MKNQFHSPRIHRWSTIANYDFPISVFQLHLEPDGELHHNPPHPPDPHLKTPMYFFLRNFSFLKISFITILDKHSHWRQINFLQWLCSTIILFSFIRSYRVLPFGRHVLWPLCCHLQTSALPSHYEQQSVPSACPQLLGSWLPNYIFSFGLGTSAGFLCFQDNWSLPLWQFSCLAALLHRYKLHRIDGFCLSCGDTCRHFAVSGPLLHIHHQNHSKIPFCSTKNKGLFHLFLTHGCCLHYLWGLYFYVYETISKGKGGLN